MSILPQTPKPDRRGCLTGCLTNVLGVLLLASVVVLATFALIAPWAFYLGGEFHPLAYWQGWGTIHAPEGDYVVFLWMGPWTGGRKTYASLSGPDVTGSGAICSPHGEVYKSLRVRGGFSNHKIGVHTDGEPMRLNLTQRLNLLGTNSDSRLNLALHGLWHNSDLVLDEEGTLRRMFNADGTLFADPRKRPAKGTPLQLILHEGSRSEFNAACAAARKKP
jgi:hypothetical protein